MPDEEEITRVSMPPLTAPTAGTAKRRVRDRGTLTVLSGSTLGAIYALGNCSVIGRARECEIQIEDTSVSRHHARITRDERGNYFLEDVGSRNGTFVNEAPIERHLLAEGDRISFGTALALRFALTDEHEEALMRRLYESTVLDGLTGAFNRKHFNERLLSEIAYAKRHGAPLSILLLDIDHFKRVNDTYGHLAGDRVLSTLASVVKRNLRTEDIFARFGGEEFVIIARGIDLPSAVLFAERIRTVARESRTECNGVSIAVTISIGVASLACCTGDATPQQMLELADKRLYVAKSAGRDRCVGA